MRARWVLVFLVSACGAREVEPYEDPSSCELQRAVDAATEDAEPEPVDCGFVVLTHDDARWQTAHDCAVAALDEGGSVQLIWQPQAIDSTHYTALVAAEAITWFEHDDYQGDIDVSSQTCSDVGVVAGCTAFVGEMCLQCIGRGDPTQICGGT